MVGLVVLVVNVAVGFVKSSSQILSCVKHFVDLFVGLNCYLQAISQYILLYIVFFVNATFLMRNIGKNHPPKHINVHEVSETSVNFPSIDRDLGFNFKFKPVLFPFV